MSKIIQIPEDEILKMFSNLEGKEVKNVMRSAVRRGAGILIREARKNFKSSVESNNHEIDKALKVKVSRFKAEAEVKFAPSMKKTSKEYVLRILEVGNYKNPRIAKRYGKQPFKNPKSKTPGFRGDLKPMLFFDKAVNSTEPTINQKMEEMVMKGIEKQFNKKINGK